MDVLNDYQVTSYIRKRGCDKEKETLREKVNLF